MGHIRLGRLPKTYSWIRVLELLATKGDISEIAEASLLAAKSGLIRVSSDPGFIHVLATVFEFVELSTSDAFVNDLLKDGYKVAENPGLFDIVSALKARLDSDLDSGRIKSDLSEIAQNSFTEILFRYASAETDSLFEAAPVILQNSIGKYAVRDRSRILFHAFFSTFTSKYLSYYLSRELSNHVGHGERFENIESHQEFDKAFDSHIRRSIHLIDEFAPEWFGKEKYERAISTQTVSRFARLAFKKICSGFSKGGEVNR